MQRIVSDPIASRTFRLLLYAPPIIGLCMVVATMLGAFFLTGVLDPEPQSPLLDTLGKALRSVGSRLDEAGSAVGGTIGYLASFAPPDRTLVLIGGTVAVLVLLAIFDRTVGRRILQRAR
jgi:hypothetical protein